MLCSVHRHFCIFAARLHTSASASACFQVKVTTDNNWIKLNPFNSAFQTRSRWIKKNNNNKCNISFSILETNFSLMWLILDVAKENTLIGLYCCSCSFCFPIWAVGVKWNLFLLLSNIMELPLPNFCLTSALVWRKVSAGQNKSRLLCNQRLGRSRCEAIPSGGLWA